MPHFCVDGNDMDREIDAEPNEDNGHHGGHHVQLTHQGPRQTESPDDAKHQRENR